MFDSLICDLTTNLWWFGKCKVFKYNVNGIRRCSLHSTVSENWRPLVVEVMSRAFVIEWNYLSILFNVISFCVRPHAYYQDGSMEWIHWFFHSHGSDEWSKEAKRMMKNYLRCIAHEAQILLRKFAPNTPVIRSLRKYKKPSWNVDVYIWVRPFEFIHHCQGESSTLLEDVALSQDSSNILQTSLMESLIDVARNY